MLEYEKAQDFATKYGVKLQVVGEPTYKKYFDDDKSPRWVFKMKLTRGKKSYTFQFGQSIASGRKEPTMYEVLACLQKHDVGNFDNFCGDYGYYGPQALKIYKAVREEWQAIQRLFSDVLEELQEIS